MKHTQSSRREVARLVCQANCSGPTWETWAGGVEVGSKACRALPLRWPAAVGVGVRRGVNPLYLLINPEYR